MPIEFRCPHCDKLLRTPDDKAGLAAHCPGCGAEVTVPAEGASTSEAHGFFDELEQTFREESPPDASAGTEATKPCPMCGEEIKAAAVKCRYCGETLEERAAAPAAGASNAADRVRGPAISLMVIAGLALALYAYNLVQHVLVLAGVGGAEQPFFEQPEEMPFDPRTFLVISLIGNVVPLAVSIVVFAGAIRMQKLKSYMLAMTSTILAITPCMWPCCILGLPFGIWGLVVLNDPAVKNAFHS